MSTEIRSETDDLGSDDAARPDGNTGRIDPPHVFISYRRTDTADLAASIADRLRADLGGQQVFRDRDDLIAGEDWREALADAIDAADTALVLIGPDWTGTSPDGGRRIDEPDDVVASECRRILDPKTRCDPLPVLIEQASPPTLASDLEPLFDHHAISTPLQELADERGEAYQQILVGVWDGVRRRTPRGVLVIGDQSALASIDAVVEEMKKSKLIDARRLSRFAAGAVVVTPRRLRKGRQRWPDAIVLVDESQPSSNLTARIKALEDNPNVRTVSLVGPGILAGFALGQVLGGSVSTIFTAGSGLSPAIPTIGTGPAGAATTAWYGATKGLRTAAVAALVGGSGLGVATASGVFQSSAAMAATYGYIEVDVKDTRETNDVPEGFDAEAGEFVAANLTITNPLSDMDLTVPAEIFEMSIDGEVVAATFAEGRNVQVNASNEVEEVLWWRFPVGTNIDDPVIQIREEGGTPLTLPVEAGEENTVPLEMNGAYETDCREITFGDGVASLNASVTSAGAPAPRPNGTELGRAAVGDIFASFEFTATERCTGGASFFHIRSANYSAIRETRVGDRLINSGHWIDDNDWTGQINSETVDGVLTMNVPSEATVEPLEIVFSGPGAGTSVTSADLSPLAAVVAASED